MNKPKSILILGAGAVGTALAEHIVKRFDGCRCVLTYRNTKPELTNELISLRQLDAGDEDALAILYEELKQRLGYVDWIINTIGILHDASVGLQPEKRLQNFSSENFQRVLNANVLPTVFAAKHLVRLFPKDQQTVFASISARVGSISDNRLGGWHSYRASKACLNMMMKNIAIEWAYKQPQCCVLVLHPGTTDSALSKPFQKNVPEGKLFSPSYCAEKLTEVICSKTSLNSGEFYDWNNQAVAW